MLVSLETPKLPIGVVSQRLLDVCGEFAVHPVAGRDWVTGNVVKGQRCGIEFAAVGLDVQRVGRSSKAIRRDQGENFFLIMQERGSAVMAQEGRAAVLNPGDMVLIDSAKPSEFIFSGSYSQQLSLHLPRVEMNRRFASMTTAGVAISARDPIGRAMHAVLAKMFMKADHDDAFSYLGEAFLSLLGAALAERAAAPIQAASGRNQTQEQLLTAAFDRIDKCFNDPEFSVSELAGVLGISPRHLQRLFQLIDETPTERLLARRLDFARTRLLQRVMGWERGAVSAIAYESGFNDLSYFNRAFRKRFGAAPGHYEEPEPSSS